MGSWRTTARQAEGGFGLSVEATFHYDPDDPWAVRIIFGPPLGRGVAWTFSRELLRRARRK